MSVLKKIVIMLLFLTMGLYAEEQAIYTFTGQKDARLDADYIVTYVSTSDSEACTQLQLATGTKKALLGRQLYAVKDGSYRVEIPLYLKEDENNCGYRFRRIELMMRRKNDDDLYSQHIILDSTQEGMAIYYGHKGGMGGKASLEMPAILSTDKKHYRIAADTKFFCSTHWYEYRKGSTFHCRMQIGDGRGENRFISTNEQNTCVTHPKFGIDAVKSETLHVDILVDDEGCRATMGKDRPNVKDHFRELPESSWAWIKGIW